MNKVLPDSRPNAINGRFKAYLQTTGLFQLVIYGIIFIVLLLLILNYPANLPQWRFFGTVIALVSLLILNILWFNNPVASTRQRLIWDWTFLILSTVLILTITLLTGQLSVAYLQSIVCIQADYRRGVWPAGVIFSLVNLVIWLVVQIALGMTFTAIVAVETSLATGFMLGLILMSLLERYSHQTQRAESLLKELQTANVALEAARQTEKDLAIAEERVRLARDIHDGLGHHLTVLSIQLQAAAKLVERDPQAAAQAIQTCRTEAQAALEEVRHSVAVMRQSPVESRPLAETLASLVRDFGQHIGIRASFECVGAPLKLTPFVNETFYRAVQESLTNTQKHGVNVQQVSVRLVYEPDSVRLLVEDDGQRPGGEPPANQPGFGLKGLHERANQLGGTFQSGFDTTRGFKTELCIPFQGNEHDPGASG